MSLNNDAIVNTILETPFGDLDSFSVISRQYYKILSDISNTVGYIRWLQDNTKDYYMITESWKNLEFLNNTKYDMQVKIIKHRQEFDSWNAYAESRSIYWKNYKETESMLEINIQIKDEIDLVIESIRQKQEDRTQSVKLPASQDGLTLARKHVEQMTNDGFYENGSKSMSFEDIVKVFYFGLVKTNETHNFMKNRCIHLSLAKNFIFFLRKEISNLEYCHINDSKQFISHYCEPHSDKLKKLMNYACGEKEHKCVCIADRDFCNKENVSFCCVEADSCHTRNPELKLQLNSSSWSFGVPLNDEKSWKILNIFCASNKLTCTYNSDMVIAINLSARLVLELNTELNTRCVQIIKTN